uniref:G_PROTEIN_RECEP_F1_2 domain-containing protein n=1 Tax=Rhabditophanes sp. KR3021 TaxID=114890 RepID=A0AC35U4H0_9BILA
MFIVIMIPSIVANYNLIVVSQIVVDEDSLFGATKFYTDDIFSYVDSVPQITISIISTIMNCVIIVFVYRVKKSSGNNNKIPDILVTINLLIHSVVPMLIVVYSNVLLILMINGFKVTSSAWKIFEVSILCYCNMLPYMFVLFIEGFFRKKFWCKISQVGSRVIPVTKGFVKTLITKQEA